MTRLKAENSGVVLVAEDFVGAVPKDADEWHARVTKHILPLLVNATSSN